VLLVWEGLGAAGIALVAVKTFQPARSVAEVSTSIPRFQISSNRRTTMKRTTSTLKRRRRRFSLEVLEERQLLATITVNTTADDTTADSTLSLREAIEISNGALAVTSLSAQEQSQVTGAVGNSNTIDFNIPTTDSGYNQVTGVWTIVPAVSALPAISTNAAIIDGYSQPGSSKNTLARGDNAKLTIALKSGFSGFDGLTLGQPGSEVTGLDIEKFQNGVVITAAGNAQVAGCFIGTDPTGEAAAGNFYGVALQNSSNLIGGPSVGDRNVISGNNGAGIYVPDKTSNPLNMTPTGNMVENNIIGLDAAGTKVLSNGQSGVSDFGSGDTYGGATAGLGNVVSGNGEVGIGASGSVTIENNYVGTDVTGNVALGNGPGASGGTGILDGDLLHVMAINSIISDNLVSGNNTGISVFPAIGSQTTYTIANNLIGTNAAGTGALGNIGVGLKLTSVQNATVQDNVISDNYDGIDLTTSTPVTQLQHDVFLGNLIGTDKTGTVPLGNKGTAFSIDPGSGITIGGTGPGEGNVIAYNTFGLIVDTGQQDQITQNSIFGNIGAPGYPPPGLIVATTANQSIAAPGLTFTPGAGGSGTLAGTLTEAPNTTYVVEVYSNPSAQAASQAQGQTFVKDVTVKTNGTGKGAFSLVVPNGFYTATATDPSGNTSQFSIAVGSATLPGTTTTVSSSLNPSPAGEPVTFTAIVAAPGYPGALTGTVTFVIDGKSQAPKSLSLIGGKEEASFVATNLAAGQHSVSATYSGDAHVSPSSGSLPTQTVTGLPATTTTVSSSLNPSPAGEPVTFTAVVTAAGYQGALTGTVTFDIDGKSEAPKPLSASGGKEEAQFVATNLAAGQHSISATYSGDAHVSPSSGSLPTQTVTATSLQSTTTTLTSSQNPSTPDESVTFAAVVSPNGTAGIPTGSVTFTIDGVAQAPATLHVVSGTDLATISISTLSAGTHTVSATYAGDGTFAASAVSTPVTQVVQRLGTTTTLVSSANPSKVGQSVTFTATVAPSSGTGAPTGAVTFTIDGIRQAPVPLYSESHGSAATFKISAFNGGAHTVSATYNGDAIFASSAVLSPIVQVVSVPEGGGPTVTSVQRFGIHMDQTVLVLSFKDGLDRTSATNLNNYQITNAAGQTVGIQSAVFDAGSNTVTLRPTTRLNFHHQFHLTVIGTGPSGVRNMHGVLLDGANNGTPGTNYTCTLTRQNLVWTPFEIQQAHHPRGR
jgi:hypothetical protein